MKKSTIIAAALVAALTSCQKEQLREAQGYGDFCIRATMEDFVGTKSTLDGATFGWTAGDAIGVYDGSTFKPYYASESAASSVFTGEKSETLQAVAVYPADLSPVYSSGLSQVTLPSRYEWKEGQTNCPMIAEFNNISDGLTFKYLGGIVKVTLKGVPAEATTLEFSTDKAITGDFSIATNDGNKEIQAASATSDINNTVTFTFEGVEAAEKVFYVPVPVGKYTMSIAVKKADGTKILTKDGTTANTIARRDIASLPTVTIDDTITGGGESGATSASVPSTHKGTFYLPSTSGTVNVTMEANENDVELVYAVDGQHPKNVNIVCNGGIGSEDGTGLAINLLESHVTVKSSSTSTITITSIDSKTSASTLVLDKSVAIQKKLTISAGSAEIACKVPELVVNKSADRVTIAAEVKTVKIVAADGESDETAPVIWVTKDGSVTDSITNDIEGAAVVAEDKTKVPATILSTNGVTTTVNTPGEYLVSGGEVTLSEDFTGNFTVAAGKNVTINLNGKTISNSESDKATFTVAEGATLTINGEGNITNTASGKPAIENNGTLTVNGGTFSGVASAIELRAGVLTINGGSFKATATSFSESGSDGFNSISGAAIAVSQYSADKDVRLVVSGGEFSGLYAIYENDSRTDTTANVYIIIDSNLDNTGEVSIKHGIPYLTFSAESEQGFAMSLPYSGLEGITFEYSVGNDEWKTLAFDTAVKFGGTGNDLRLRGKSPVGTAKDGKHACIWFTNGVDVECSGDIRTLVDWEDYANADTKDARFSKLFLDCPVLTSAPKLPAKALADYCYNQMFANCTKLENAPELPATTLKEGCYARMFYECTKLKTAPELPAETLASNCYDSMFYGCSALTSVPEELPAKSLAGYCYFDMFTFCSSLKNAPKLPATTLAESCYREMFYGCSSLKNAPELPATKLAYRCYSYMFYGCSLQTAPELPAKTLEGWCYAGMFDCCSSLGSIELPAETLAEHCYYEMLRKCTSLTSITLRATSKESDSLGGWLNYTVADDGKTRTIYCADSSIIEGAYPDGWTVRSIDDFPCVTFSAASEQGFKMTLDGVENTFQYSVGGGKWKNIESGVEVPFGGTKGNLRLRGKSSNGTATDANNYYSTISFTNDVAVECTGDIRTLVNWEDYANADTKDARFAYLFKGCSVLTSAPTLPAMKLADYCYYYMFVDCTSLKTAPELPATTLAGSCYKSMFHGCTSLNAAPKLPATTLARACYMSMFRGCTALTSTPTLSAKNLDVDCYNSMFADCTALTSAPELPATTLALCCYSNMFLCCTSLQTAPKLPATTLAVGCYSNMFDRCTSLKTAPELPAETLAGSCYMSMFSGCTSLGSIELPAKELAESCYQSMFQSCTSLTSITLRATKTASYALYKWIEDTVTSDGKTRTIYTDLSLTEGTGYPTGWTVKTLTPYVTFSAASEQGFKMKLDGVENTFQYSVGGGEWTAIASGEEVKFGGTGNDLRLRGKSSVGTAKVTDSGEGYFRINGSSTINFTNADVKVKCTGDIRTLVDWENYANADTKDAVFVYLFEGCTVLTSAPELPATTLADCCYYSMFAGCSSLTSAPALPATALSDYCYYHMFHDCTSLETAPKLPAETLTSGCYSGMFGYCTLLTSAPELPAEKLATHCYSGMFSYCTKLNSEIVLPATTLAGYCYNAMFERCTSLTSITIRATSTADGSLSGWLSEAVPTTSDGKTRTIYCADSSIIEGTYPEKSETYPSGWTATEL